MKLTEILQESLLKTFFIDKKDIKSINALLDKHSFIDPIDYMILGETLKIYTKNILDNKKIMGELDKLIKVK